MEMMNDQSRTGAPKNRAYEYLLTNIEEVLRRLQSSRFTDNAVHDARKALKKARAALRLLEDGMPQSTYRTQNRALRDAGRCLSQVRDAKSLLGALASLQERYADGLDKSKIAPLQKALRHDLRSARHHLAHERGVLKGCITLLIHARRSAEQAKLANVDHTAVRSGLKRVYRKGRNALGQAKKSATPEALHEWRKQVKYLLNALNGPVGPTNGTAQHIRKGADRLADRLGEDHDLAVLAAQAAQNSHCATAAELLQPLICKRRKKLQKDAFKLGRKIYNPKPRTRAESLLKSSQVG